MAVPSWGESRQGCSDEQRRITTREIGEELDISVASVCRMLAREQPQSSSIEQSWFVYPEAPAVPVGPQWRITFWEKHTPQE